jgi:hypothetical protein
MKTFIGYFYEGSYDSIHSQLFYQIDEDHCVGEIDKCVYQIVPLYKLFSYNEDEDGNIDEDNVKFIGDFHAIADFINFDEKVCINYAEDGSISDYFKSDFEDIDGIDNVFDDDYMMNVIKGFDNPCCTDDYPSINEMRFIIEDSIDKL